MEVDRVLQKLRDFFGVEVFVLIHKDVLDRKKWEDGMRTLGRSPDWERFPEEVLSSHTRQAVPAMLAERLARGALSKANNGIVEMSSDGTHRLTLLPLYDAGSRNVAHMALLADVSQDLNVALRTVYVGSIAALVAGMLLLGFFYWQVGRIGRRIEADAQELEQLATHDGLTGLYNHRQFYTLLEDEIDRARRYHHSVSLFMLDIDHFKRVNDSHGHQAGDAVLRGLSDRLAGQVRNIDRLCRYGGEEIALILPGTEDAGDVAERLRACIEAEPFEVGGGKQLAITVSIGTASCPGDAGSGEALVTAADSALYTAKKTGRNRVCAYKREEVGA